MIFRRNLGLPGTHGEYSVGVSRSADQPPQVHHRRHNERLSNACPLPDASASGACRRAWDHGRLAPKRRDDSAHQCHEAAAVVCGLRGCFLFQAGATLAYRCMSLCHRSMHHGSSRRLVARRPRCRGMRANIERGNQARRAR